MTTGAVNRAKLQSNHRHQQTMQHPVSFTGRMPFLSPTNNVKALKGKISHSMDLLTPNSPGGLPTLSLTTNSSWLPWGRVAMPLISPLMPVSHNYFTVCSLYFSQSFLMLIVSMLLCCPATTFLVFLHDAVQVKFPTPFPSPDSHTSSQYSRNMIAFSFRRTSTNFF